MADYHRRVIPADLLEREHSVVAEPENSRQLSGHQRAERRADKAECADVGREFSDYQRRTALSGDAGRNNAGSHSLQRYDVGTTETGLTENDRTGNAIIERIRATAAGLRAAAERVGSRLLGVAEDVWHYATGERGAERARIGLEQAGAEFERAAAPLVRQMNAIEQRRELEHRQRQELQHEKTPERQRTLSLGNREYGD